MASQAKTKTTTLAEAKEDMAEKVSVAGFKEAIQEKIFSIRLMYQISLVILSGCCFYYVYQVLKQHIDSGYKNEVTDLAEEEFLPFSNVTICVEAYLNISFVKENIAIPEKVAESYTKETGQPIDELFYQLAKFLAQATRVREFAPTLMIYFSKIFRANPQFDDYAAFAAKASLKCSSVFKKCSFNGVEFECCDRVVQSIDADGTCYLLALNFDSDNAIHSNLTSNQKRPGPKDGLTVEASMDLKVSPWMDDVVDNGFKVFVGAVPNSDVQSPLGAPHGAETFIVVKAAKRVLSTECAPQGHLSTKEDFKFFYDPEGFGCFYQAVLDMAYTHVSCHYAIGLYRPNSSIVCSPSVVHFVSLALAAPDLYKHFQWMIMDGSVGIDELRLNHSLKNLEDTWKTAFSDKSFCPPHCQRWTYSSAASFVYLEQPGKDTDKENITFSKIHVFYGDLGYRQHNQVKETTIYLAFCDFGNVVGFYWGMSIISFFHVLWYVPRYFYFLRKSRKVGPQITEK